MQARSTAAENLTVDRIIQWLEGQYSNQAQFSSGEMEDRSHLLYPVFKRIDVPAFGSHVVYLQWPIGAPDGPLQRQRIWTFAADDSSGQIRMNFYTLKEPDLWRDAHVNSVKVQSMTPEDTIGYPESCLLPVTFVSGLIRAAIPPTCEIVSQSTRTTMTLQSNITIAPDQITYREGGVRPDGTVVFTVPAKGEYVFERTVN